MEIGFRQDGEFGILRLSGSFEKLSIAELRRYLELVVENACPYMILDLTMVDKLSTSGLGMIFSGRSRLDDVGTLMALVGSGNELASILSSGNLGKMVPLCESIEKAKITLRKLAYEKRAEKRRRQRPRG